jgi:uncharacterized protein YdiU (UPF0061 family)
MMNVPLRHQSLDSMLFDNRFIRDLPGDEVRENYRRQVTGACYSRVLPTRVSSPRLVACSREAAGLLGLSEERCSSRGFTELFAGNEILDGMDPFAMCYGGHQFGSWAGQLGDGRAINLGEVVNSNNEHWTLQLKGAGPTPYSRNADGLAVLRSSIREFLCSEAMHHLGIPTTRALSVIATGEPVLRDMFYDGNPKTEPGAVVCRLSPSFIRFGNFEILTARNELELLKRLADHTIAADFSHLGKPCPETYAAWFHEICRRTATLILHWMRVGFVHGVMNTDNMSILGLTIDYGPYGWLEGYEPGWTPNTTDAHGRRYSFSNQPHIGQWNLLQLANAIYPLVKESRPFEDALADYNLTFTRGWNRTMTEKLGLRNYNGEQDNRLIGDLVDVLQLTETDMTIFFRRLASIPILAGGENFDEIPGPLLHAYYAPENIPAEQKRRILDWLTRYCNRIRQDGDRPGESRREAMNRVNPKYVLRNYLVQVAIEGAENGDYEEVHNLLDLMRKPYDEQPANEKYFARRPEWARHKAGCSMLSCSS